MDEDTYGVLDEALLRPPQLLGCERTPFLFVIFSATFLTVAVFGVTFPGLVAGIMLAAAGVMVLRRIAAHDPFWFAVQFAASRYPRHMPDVLPDTTIPRDLAFVGYDDPPSDRRGAPGAGLRPWRSSCCRPERPGCSSASCPRSSCLRCWPLH